MGLWSLGGKADEDAGEKLKGHELPVASRDCGYRGFGEAEVAGCSVGREEVEGELGMARLMDLEAVGNHWTSGPQPFWHQGPVLL